jgi:hypothetical protein
MLSNVNFILNGKIFFDPVRYNGDGSRWHGIDDSAPPDVVGDFRQEEVNQIF